MSKDTSEYSENEEIEKNVFISEDFNQALTDLSCGDTDTIINALCYIQDSISNNPDQAIELVTFSHIQTISSFILVPELTKEAFYTLSLIQVYSTEYTDYYLSDEFIDILKQFTPYIDSVLFHSFCSFCANVAHDNDKFIDCLMSSEILQTLILRKDLKQTYETKKFISYLIIHLNISGDFFRDILYSQVEFLNLYLKKEEFDSNPEKFIKVNQQKDVILLSILNTLRLGKNDKNSEQKTNQIIAFLLNKEIYKTLLEIADMQIVPVSVTSIEIMEHSLVFNSLVSDVLNNLNLFGHLKNLLNSESNEIITESLRCMTAFICCFPEMSFEGIQTFIDFDFLRFFVDGYYYQKQAIITFLSQIILDMPEEMKRIIFSHDFISDLIDFSEEVPEQKIFIYRLIGSLIRSNWNKEIHDIDWIFSILDELEFWEKVEEEQYNDDNEQLLQCVSALLELRNCIQEGED